MRVNSEGVPLPGAGHGLGAGTALTLPVARAALFACRSSGRPRPLLQAQEQHHQIDDEQEDNGHFQDHHPTVGLVVFK